MIQLVFNRGSEAIVHKLRKVVLQKARQHTAPALRPQRAPLLCDVAPLLPWHHSVSVSTEL